MQSCVGMRVARRALSCEGAFRDKMEAPILLLTSKDIYLGYKKGERSREGERTADNSTAYALEALLIDRNLVDICVCRSSRARLPCEGCCCKSCGGKKGGSPAESLWAEPRFLKGSMPAAVAADNSLLCTSELLTPWWYLQRLSQVLICG
jgi:hypothetical protein